MMKITSASIFFWKNRPNNFDLGLNLNKTGTMEDVLVYKKEYGCNEHERTTIQHK